MSQIRSVNPFRCRVWDLHDRLDHLIVEDGCRNEISSFAKNGQLIPALGRPLRDDPDYEVELICGARRLFVARHLNLELLVDLRELTDQDAIIAMDVENRQRQDISPYERGLSFALLARGLLRIAGSTRQGAQDLAVAGVASADPGTPAKRSGGCLQQPAGHT